MSNLVCAGQRFRQQEASGDQRVLRERDRGEICKIGGVCSILTTSKQMQKIETSLPQQPQKRFFGILSLRRKLKQASNRETKGSAMGFIPPQQKVTPC